MTGSDFLPNNFSHPPIEGGGQGVRYIPSHNLEFAQFW